jgi:hypothetical protein
MHKEGREILDRFRFVCSCNRSSHLLKELGQSSCRDGKHDQRLAGNVAPAVPCSPGHMKVIPGFCLSPFVALWALPQRLDLAGDNKKIFRVRMTVHRNRDAGWDDSLQHAEVNACLVRRRQKLDRRSEEIEVQAGRGIHFSAHIFREDALLGRFAERSSKPSVPAISVPHSLITSINGGEIQNIGSNDVTKAQDSRKQPLPV